MTGFEFSQVLILTAPVVSAMICLVLTIFARRSSRPVCRSIYYRIIITYCCVTLYWTGMIIYSVSREAFVWSLPVFMPVMMLMDVFVYQLIYIITNADGVKTRFVGHFIFPLCVAVVELIIMLVVPFSERMEMVYGPAPNGTAIIMVGICVVYGTLYSVMGLRRIIRCKRKTVNVALNRQNVSLNWLFYSILAEIVVLPIPACGFLFGMDGTAINPVWVVLILPIFFIHLILCYNLMPGNYVIVEEASPKEDDSVENSLHLSRSRVEEYLDDKKPFLNPDFKIADLAQALYSNRAYVSAFINREYGMNFNRFINGYRLKEVERLRAEASQKNLRISSLQLVLNSGFSNYRSYHRAKNMNSEEPT